MVLHERPINVLDPIFENMKKTSLLSNFPKRGSDLAKNRLKGHTVYYGEKIRERADILRN